MTHDEASMRNAWTEAVAYAAGTLQPTLRGRLSGGDEPAGRHRNAHPHRRKPADLASRRRGIRACLAGHRVAFRTATEWVALLADAQRQGRLDSELDRLQRIPLLIVDEVGYIPFDPHAANLMFILVSRRYERASMIVTSNKPFSAWGEIFGDEVTAAAMIDRLVHHAEILALKGDSYRLKDRDLARPPRTTEQNSQALPAEPGPATPARHPHLDPEQVAHFSTGTTGPHFNRP